jgi:hypothetical protein
MYLILRVKLNRRKRLPTNPQASEAALRAMHLRRSAAVIYDSVKTNVAYHRGSGFPVESACADIPVSPLSSFLQEVTNAAIDMTLAMGANVAAMSGIAVEANHQSLSEISA